MNRSNSLSPVSSVFDGFTQSSSEPTNPADITESQSFYRGMQVQAVMCSDPVLVKQELAGPGTAYLTQRLNQYSVVPLSDINLHSIPANVADAQTHGLDIYLHDFEPVLLEDLDDIEPAVLEDLDDSQPIAAGSIQNTETERTVTHATETHSQSLAVVNQLDTQQATNNFLVNQAEQMPDRIEDRKKYNREYRKNRYQNDSAYAENERERQKKYNSEYRKNRCQNDPAYAERERERQRKYNQERRDKRSAVRIATRMTPLT